MKGVDAIVLAVRHDPYLKLDPDKVSIKHRPSVCDCGLLLCPQQRPDSPVPEMGCEVKGMGHGHIKQIKDSLEGRHNGKKGKG